MTIYELAEEYEEQYRVLRDRIEGLRPLLCVYKGDALLDLRRRIKTYYDMAADCRRTSTILLHYYENGEDAHETQH